MLCTYIDTLYICVCTHMVKYLYIYTHSPQVSPTTAQNLQIYGQIYLQIPWTGAARGMPQPRHACHLARAGCLAWSRRGHATKMHASWPGTAGLRHSQPQYLVVASLRGHVRRGSLPMEAARRHKSVLSAGLHIYLFIHIYRHVFIHVHTYTYICLSMHAEAYVYIYIYVYIGTEMQYSYI